MLRRSHDAGHDAAANPAATPVTVPGSELPALQVQAALRPRRRIAWRRAVPGIALPLALAMLMSACPGNDRRGAINVREVPVDLRFGGVDKFLPKAPPPVVFPKVLAPPDYKVPDFTLPDFSFDFERRKCVLTNPSAREVAKQQWSGIPEYGRGEFVFEYKGTINGKKYDKLSSRRVSQVSAGDGQDNLTPPTEEGPDYLNRENRFRDTIRYQVGDGLSSMKTMYLIKSGEDNDGSKPDVGYFLDRLIIPYHYTKGDYPRHPVEGIAQQWPYQTVPSTGVPIVDRAVQPDGTMNSFRKELEYDTYPALKLLAFPVVPGQKQKGFAFDPFRRAFVTSYSRVVKLTQVRACDELQQAYETEWVTTIGRLPDLKALLSDYCGTAFDEPLFRVREIIKGFLFPGPIHRGLDILANQIAAEAIIFDDLQIPEKIQPLGEGGPTVDVPIDLVREQVIKPYRETLLAVAEAVRALKKSVQDVDGTTALQLLDEQVEPTIREACSLSPFGEVFVQNRKFIDYEIDGTYWFATQMGGWPIKEIVDYRIPNKGLATGDPSHQYFEGHMESTIYNLDPEGSDG